MVRVCVEDDGVGMPERNRDPSGKGLGWRLVEALSKQLRATLEVTCGSGTRVGLRFSDGTASIPTRGTVGSAFPSEAAAPLTVTRLEGAHNARSGPALEAEV